VAADLPDPAGEPLSAEADLLWWCCGRMRADESATHFEIMQLSALATDTDRETVRRRAFEALGAAAARSRFERTRVEARRQLAFLCSPYPPWEPEPPRPGASAALPAERLAA
jgi:hypothetical protein